jgi:FMN reductase
VSVTTAPSPPRRRSVPLRSWLGVLAVAAATFVMVTVDALPVGLLTPIGTAFHASAGAAALTVTLPGLAAALAAPLLPVLIRRADRRHVLLTLVAAVAAALSAGIVVGNPKPSSRTFHAAAHLVERLTGHGPRPAVDLAAFGSALLDWSDAEVEEAARAVRALDLVVFASPTYKASYTGLLKLFLDRLPANALDGVVAVPLMLGAGPGHALAPEVFLKPVLAELGAVLPTKALYLLDSAYDDPAAYEPWLTAATPRIAAALKAGAA